MSAEPIPPPDPFDHIRQWDQRRAQTGWWHSFELPDGRLIEGVMNLEGLRRRLGRFPIPADLDGKRVLDIGAWDGWFSFEMEKRGAEVVAIDNWDNPRFREMQAALGSRVDYRVLDVYDATPERLGRFDIVLFLGVLYHLKHPLLALERVCALSTDFAAVESFVLPERLRPGDSGRTVMEFYETNDLGGQADNWIGPSVACLLAFCRTAGFARVELLAVDDFGAAVGCHRRWAASPPLPDVPMPHLYFAAHHTNYGINFRSNADDYVDCVFDWAGAPLSRDRVEPEVGGYGVRPLMVAPFEEGRWVANFKLPPGLQPGWHSVRLRAASGEFSNEVRIAVDMLVRTERLVIAGVRDAITFRAGQSSLSTGGYVSLWIEGLPENADRNNVEVLLGETRLTVLHITPPETLVRQVNIQLGPGVAHGEYRLRVRSGGAESGPTPVVITA